MQLRIGNFMYYFKKGFYMIRKNLHMKIKRIFCGILTAAMLLGQTGAVWAEATDTASESPTPTPDPHTEYYAQAADTDSIEGWTEGPKIEAQSAVLMDLNTEAVLYSKNANTQLYPASITKLLTCHLGCENLDVNAQLTLSQQAAYGIEREVPPFMVMPERFLQLNNVLWH